MITNKQVEAAWSVIRTCGTPVGVGDGNTYVPRMPNADDIRRILEAAEAAAWSPISEAPKDGTVIDIYDGEYRWADCYWGKPCHCCGEAQQYCDDDWHRETDGWVYAPLNQRIEINGALWRPIETRGDLERANRPIPPKA